MTDIFEDIRVDIIQSWARGFDYSLYCRYCQGEKTQPVSKSEYLFTCKKLDTKYEIAIGIQDMIDWQSEEKDKEDEKNDSKTKSSTNPFFGKPIC